MHERNYAVNDKTAFSPKNNGLMVLKVLLDYYFSSQNNCFNEVNPI